VTRKEVKPSPAQAPARPSRPAVKRQVLSKRPALDASRRPTMADVAKLAGVSPTTVSLVINEKPDSGIPAQTQDRVHAAVAQLGFRPNEQARSLALRRSKTIGFIGEAIGTPYGGRTISGAHERARKQGNLLLMVDADPPHARQIGRAVDDLLERQVDSIILATEGTRRAELPEYVRRVPTVLVNCFNTGGSLPSLLPDEEAGGRSAARLLLEAGHRQITYLAGLSGSWATRRRLTGFRAQLREAAIPTADFKVLFGDFHADSGYELAQRVLAGGDIPTAFFCGNDRMALGAYFALSEHGLSIPRDVSVLGYDDQEELASDMHPALTTVQLPYYEMGRLAVEHILSGAVSKMPSRTYVACPLVLRSSVGPPRTHRL
jgi:LacI family transcriptional regulator